MQAFVAAFKEVAAYLWQAVSKKEALSASEDAAMDTGRHACASSLIVVTAELDVLCLKHLLRMMS